MIREEINDMEIASPSVVSKAARDFAAALVETPQFKAFEQASEALRTDENAQRTMEAYQTKQMSLRALLMLNAVPVEEQAELEQLRQAFMNEPAVSAYFQAQSEITVMCQAAADLLSKHVGLSFAAACGPGCC
jgi:cell fate (sporulation/competence/biofilm development) regulator YlbF (YheA/YmcA/DUF963 family)